MSVAETVLDLIDEVLLETRRHTDRVLDGMPDGRLEARRLITRELGFEPRPEVLQTIVRIATDASRNTDLQELSRQLLAIRVRPYYLFYCEPAPGLDHFRTPVEKGAELIRDAIRGHTTGMAQPMYVVATNIGKIPISRNYYFVEKNETEYIFRNHKGEKTTLPNIP